MLQAAFYHTFFAPWNWALFWWAPLLTRPRCRLGRFFAGVMALYFLALLVFVVSCFPSPEAVGNSWGRYLLPLAPWAVLYLGASLSYQE